MPIEIRELHIKAVIDGGGNKPGAAQAGAEATQPGTSSQNAEELIDLCVEKVMEILKEKRER